MKPFIRSFSGFNSIYSDADLGNEGFTITEFLIVFAMVSILLTGMIRLFGILNQSYTTQNVAAGVQQVARAGMNIMTRHIRMAGFNPLRLPDVGIKEDIFAGSIHFSYDLNGDGILEPKEDVRFEVVGGVLVKKSLKRSEPLANNISDLRFTYINGDEQITNDHRLIKTVMISLTVTEPAGRRKPVSRTFSTRVICRNLGL